MIIAVVNGWRALVLLAFSIYITWYFFFRREPGFKEWVKDPSLFDKFTGRTEDHQALLAAADHWSDADLKKHFERYIWKPGNRSLGLQLELLKTQLHRVRPLALAVLADSSRRAKLTKRADHKFFGRSPFDRVCGLLAGPAAAAAIPLLVPFQSHLDDDIRQNAAVTLGGIGTPEAAGPLRTSLHDGTDGVRLWAILGLQRAKSAEALHPDCILALFADLKQLVLKGQNLGAAVDLMMAVDAGVPREILLRDEALQPDNPNLPEILSSLASHQIPVPRGKLLTMIETLERRPPDYPFARALASALELLGQQRNPDDRDFLQARVAHANKSVAEGAAEAMVAWVGLAGIRDRLWTDLRGRELADLPAAHRHYLAAWILDGEVNNGGFSQYFFNHSGDSWREAQAGLAAMGFSERGALLQEALGTFGASGPSTDHEQRQEELLRLAKANDDLFGALDTRYYESEENTEIIASAYVWNNPELFRKE